MHSIQQKLLKLADSYSIGNMSFREIARIIGAEHPQLVKHHLEQLEKKDFITWDKENKLIEKKTVGVISNIDFTVVPVLGAANCGQADIYADESITGHIKVSNGLIGNRSHVFAIKASGHSMNKANVCGKNIEDGDYVIVDPSDKNVRTNDYVLSVIDEVANIKKIIVDKIHSQITLKSESTFHYPDIYINASEASRYLINGKIIQVIKQVKVS
ncbi:MAG: S24 family peptidase [Ferruginibacter sp.]